jgi:hypothetical protein
MTGDSENFYLFCVQVRILKYGSVLHVLMKRITRGFSITSVHSVHLIVIKVNSTKSDERNRINNLQLLQIFQFQRLMKLIRSMKCLLHNNAALISQLP